VVRFVLFLSLACAALASSAGAAPATFTYDRELAIVARETLWRALGEEPPVSRREVERVSVRCYRTRKSFERAYERWFEGSARRVVAYYAGGRDLHLRRGTCRNARLFLAGRHTLFTSAAFSILLHESLHRQGVRTERVATCFANDAVRWGALWFGFSDARAIRARNLAFDYTRRYSPPSYFMGRPTCLMLARRSDWTAFR
jgi:hypothetical protein